MRYCLSNLFLVSVFVCLSLIFICMHFAWERVTVVGRDRESKAHDDYSAAQFQTTIQDSLHKRFRKKKGGFVVVVWGFFLCVCVCVCVVCVCVCVCVCVLCVCMCV